MTTITQAKPIVDEVSAPFWQGRRDGKLLIQWCEPCGKGIHYPRLYCPHCLNDSLTWKESKGQGKLHAFTIVHYHPDPYFKEQVPYVMGLVELEGGVRMMSRIVDVEPSPDAVRVGMDLTARFKPVDDHFAFHEFAPSTAESNR